jgi:hypothetical protein
MIALLALLLHIAIPTLYDMAPPAVQGLMQITICAGGEPQQITIDASGKPTSPAIPNNHDCHSCMHHCGGLTLTAAINFAPQIFAAEIIALAGGQPHGLVTTLAHARGPPL